MVNPNAVRVLYENDPEFVRFAAVNFGARTAESVISKMSPDPSAVHVAGGLKRKKVQKNKVAEKFTTTRTGPNPPKKPPKTGKMATARRYAIGTAVAIPAAVGGYYLHKKGKQTFGTDYQKKARIQEMKDRKQSLSSMFQKSVDADSMICKVDEDKRQVFGWASITHVNGEPVVDRQGDMVSLEEVEKSAYDYVVKSRVGGSQHKRDGDQPFHAADLIESFVVTEDKAKAMGLGDDAPQGWWVGFKVNDDDTWAKVKNGDVTGFSVHGRGKREHIEGEMTPAEVSHG